MGLEEGRNGRSEVRGVRDERREVPVSDERLREHEDEKG